MAYEIELKLKLFNSEQVMAFLSKNASFMYEEHQVDDYYNPPHKNFFANFDQVTEWFRLRRTNDKNSINYKDYSKITYCTELESFVENIDEVEKILEVLNFKKIITVDKKRRAWFWKDIEISIDEVVGLGTFIELEYKGAATEEIEKVRNVLFETIIEIGGKTGENEGKGYPWLLMKGLKNAE